ncbi:MAG: ATP synthase F0 subunit C [Deferrisomatales bacterium]
MDAPAWTHAAAYLAAGLAMGIGAIGAAVGEGHTAAATSEAVARQPGAAQPLLRTMLVGQAVAESASIFALVVAIILLFSPWSPSMLQAVALLSAGLCMGAGALGSGVGAGLPGATACRGIARNPRTASRVTTTLLVGQAVAQTPAVFALLVAFLMLFRDYSAQPATLAAAGALLGAGISTGLGAVGPGLGAGFAAAAACDATSRRPRRASVLLRTMLVGQAVSQSTSIYALVVSLVLLYVA